MQRAPPALDSQLQTCYQRVEQIEGVAGIKDPHFWTLCRFALLIVLSSLHDICVCRSCLVPETESPVMPFFVVQFHPNWERD